MNTMIKKINVLQFPVGLPRGGTEGGLEPQGLGAKGGGKGSGDRGPMAASNLAGITELALPLEVDSSGGCAAM